MKKKRTASSKVVKSKDLIEIVEGFFIYKNDSENRQQQGETRVIATELKSVEQAEGFIQGYAEASCMESFDDIDPDVYPVMVVEYVISVNGIFLTGLEYYFNHLNEDDLIDFQNSLKE